MRKIFYIGVIIIFIVLVLLVINSSSELYDISEEASPIREGDRIVGMDYSVTLGEDVKGNNVNIATSILSSIVHYKDINSINDFYIDLKINNKTKSSYLLKNIMLVGNNGLSSKKLKYKKNSNHISIKLNRNDILKYSDDSFIKIELEK